MFHRVDLPAPVTIPAQAVNVGDTRLSSTLALHGTSISTVEHMMSALAGVGVDNLHVDVARDRNCRSWMAAPDPSCSCCSRRESSSSRRRSAISACALRSRFHDGDKWARFDPVRGLQLDFTIDFASGLRHGEPARRRRFRGAFVREGSRPRARSASCRTSKRCARPGSRSAGPAERDRPRRDAGAEHRRTPGTTTSSSSTRCWTRSAICTCSAVR